MNPLSHDECEAPECAHKWKYYRDIFDDEFGVTFDEYYDCALCGKTCDVADIEE